MTLTDVSMALIEMRKCKPHTIKHLFGSNGPTKEQLQTYNDRVKNWNREYRKLTQLHKKLLSISNEAFRKAKS